MITDEVMGDILSKTFTVLSNDVPELPPMTWSDSKAMRAQRSPSPVQRLVSAARSHKRWTFSIMLVAGVAGAGAGAAASGVFSPQANKSFSQDYAQPLPAAFGQIPAFDPSKEKLEVVEPGPKGTTISVWTYPESSSILCVAGVESKPGKATFPGKPGRAVPVGGCSGSPSGQSKGSSSAVSDQIYGADGGIWRAYSGDLFRILAGNAPRGARSIGLTLSNGSIRTVVVKNGWYAIALPYKIAFGFTGTFYGPDGAALRGTTSG